MNYIGMKKFIKSNKKGITLVEMVITLGIIAAITPVLFAIFTYGVDVFYSYGRFVKQQDDVAMVLSHVRDDVKNAYLYKVEDDNKLTLKYTDGTQRVWYLDDDKLKYINESGVQSDVVQGIDTGVSSIRHTDSGGVIVLSIQPHKTNTGRFTARNFNKSIITEFSVKYKGTIP